MSIHRKKDPIEKVIEQARELLEKLLLLQREDPREFEERAHTSFQKELLLSFDNITAWSTNEFLQHVTTQYPDPLTLELLADVIRLKGETAGGDKALYAKSLALYDHIYTHAGTLSFNLLSKKTALEQLLKG